MVCEYPCYPSLMYKFATDVKLSYIHNCKPGACDLLVLLLCIVLSTYVLMELYANMYVCIHSCIDNLICVV